MKKNHPLYKTWENMKQRCFNPNNPKFHNHGGRGITVCDEWVVDFLCFLKDVGEKPNPEHSLDRIDNNGNYCKENIRWADKQTQALNRRFKDNGLCKYKGVYRLSMKGRKTLRKKFGAQIGHRGKTYHLGTFSTQEEAAQAFDKKYVEIYGNSLGCNQYEQFKKENKC